MTGVSDLWRNELLNNPGWQAFYDQNPVAAKATRRKIYDMLVAERISAVGAGFKPALTQSSALSFNRKPSRSCFSA